MGPARSVTETRADVLFTTLGACGRCNCCVGGSRGCVTLNAWRAWAAQVLPRLLALMWHLQACAYISWAKGLWLLLGHLRPHTIGACSSEGQTTASEQANAAVSTVLGQVAACVDDRLDVSLHVVDGLLHEALGQGHGTLPENINIEGWAP